MSTFAVDSKYGKVLPTTYRGTAFRSRLEARWAVFFDEVGVSWEYEPEGFESSDGVRYSPDFWLPDVRTGPYPDDQVGCFFEVKPDRQSLDSEKAFALVKITQRVLVVGCGKPIQVNDQIFWPDLIYLSPYKGREIKPNEDTGAMQCWSDEQLEDCKTFVASLLSQDNAPWWPQQHFDALRSISSSISHEEFRRKFEQGGTRHDALVVAGFVDWGGSWQNTQMQPPNGEFAFSSWGDRSINRSHPKLLEAANKATTYRFWNPSGGAR